MTSAGWAQTIRMQAMQVMQAMTTAASSLNITPPFF